MALGGLVVLFEPCVLAAVLLCGSYVTRTLRVWLRACPYVGGAVYCVPRACPYKGGTVCCVPRADYWFFGFPAA